LPHNAQFFAKAVLGHALQRHCMLELLDYVILRAARQALLMHLSDRPAGTTHADKLTRFGHVSRSGWRQLISHLPNLFGVGPPSGWTQTCNLCCQANLSQVSSPSHDRTVCVGAGLVSDSNVLCRASRQRSTRHITALSVCLR